ncbi:MAG: PASTA domain-containing protein [Azospirillaceae bacterium]
MPPSRTARLAALPILLIALALAACAQPGTGPGARPEATLRVSGPNVTLGGRPASDGMAVPPGVEVATGPGSSARIEFADGTVLQLGPDTDPVWESVVEAGRRTVSVSISFGSMMVETGAEFSVRVFNEIAEVLYLSRGYVLTGGGRFEAVLESGTLQPLRPFAPALEPYRAIIVERGRPPAIVAVPPSRMRDLRRRFERFDFARLPTLPGLRGVPVEEARRRLAALGIERVATREETTGAARPGTVLRQYPEAGTTISRGDRVELVVARAPEPVTLRVPDVVQRPLSEAEAILRRRGLAIGKVTGPPGGDVSIVVDQRPRAGTDVEEGTRVDLEVAPLIE